MQNQAHFESRAKLLLQLQTGGMALDGEGAKMVLGSSSLGLTVQAPILIGEADGEVGDDEAGL